MLLREVDVWVVAVVSSQVWCNYGADLSAEDVFLITLRQEDTAAALRGFW